jgi:hypothetical protein
MDSVRSEVWGFRGCDCEDFLPLWCNAVYFGICLPIFRRNDLPPSSENNLLPCSAFSFCAFVFLPIQSASEANPLGPACSYSVSPDLSIPPFDNSKSVFIQYLFCGRSFTALSLFPIFRSGLLSKPYNSLFQCYFLHIRLILLLWRWWHHVPPKRQ